MSVIDSIESGLFRIAAEPDGQPTRDALRGADGYTIPLIAHDYPARTAQLWNAVYRSLGMPFVNCMVVADPTHLSDIVSVFQGDRKYHGGGAGVGFKDEMLPFLHHIEPIAMSMGAVNIIRRGDDGRLSGWNTDGDGFAVSLAQALGVLGKGLDGEAVVLIGAGGAANAIAFALAMRGARLRIINRTEAKAVALADNLRRFLIARGKHATDGITVHAERDIVAVVGDAVAIVNASWKGGGVTAAYSALAPIELPETPERVANNHVVARSVIQAMRSDAVIADIVLGHGATTMLRQGKVAGHPTLDGIPMVVEQAIDAFSHVYPGTASRDRIAELMWATQRPS